MALSSTHRVLQHTHTVLKGTHEYSHDAVHPAVLVVGERHTIHGSVWHHPLQRHCACGATYEYSHGTQGVLLRYPAACTKLLRVLVLVFMGRIEQCTAVWGTPEDGLCGKAQLSTHRVLQH